MILEAAGIRVVVRPASIAEDAFLGEGPVDTALRLAAQKAESVAAGFGTSDPLAAAVVLAADTVVWQGSETDGFKSFPKPSDEADARRILALLSGGWHQVTTGFYIRAGNAAFREAVTTAVRFRSLEKAEIERYVATGEPMDKAGAYAIQGAGGAMVAELRGSYTNVVGLPLEEVLAALRRVPTTRGDGR
jgi:septum formation protein